MGRKAGTDNKIFNLTVRLTASDYKMVVIMAKKQDITPSQLIRNLIEACKESHKAAV